MESGPSVRSLRNNDQRACESVLLSAGRSGKDKTSSGRMARPSATRCQAASKRSSASPAGPSRISSFLDIALEVIAQLLDRLEVITPAAVVHHPIPCEAIAQIVVQLDLEDSLLGHDALVEQQ